MTTATANQANRESIANKMRALHAKTVENGCTEAEATQAMEILAKLQEKYNMTLDSATAMGEGVVMAAMRVNNPIVFYAAMTIGKATDTSAIVSEANKSVLFFGTAHDAEYAVYLLSIVHHAVKTLFNKFIPTKEYFNLRKAGNSEAYIRESFCIGVIERLNARLLAIHCPLEQQTTTGQEIVIIKANKQQEKLEQLGLNECKAVSKSVKIIKSVADAGSKAADEVAFNKGISATPANLKRIK